MNYNPLYLLVEGDDDERFFNKIIQPAIEGKYYPISIIKYANMKKEKLEGWLASIKGYGAKYLFMTDFDVDRCITKTKQGTLQKAGNMDADKIIVVKKEIESWYLAGLCERDLRKFGIAPLDATDTITKENFNQFISKKFSSRIDFMIETTKCFSVETAKSKNKSFSYFIGKLDRIQTPQ
ncbi:MAG: hypothetical protein PHH26_07050 [Candidatus Thermoplasmatota archaeon]|nr:hypothetical protein [Candidatus Thermoplasmatota archaeon]